MAVQVKPYVRMSSHGVVFFEVFMEYEDTDFRATNDDGEPDDFRVVRWFGVNGPVTRTITVFRKNGNVWRAVTIPAGAVFEQAAGGPVRYESDVPVWVYG